jgi:hypothetical protein
MKWHRSNPKRLSDLLGQSKNDRRGDLKNMLVPKTVHSGDMRKLMHLLQFDDSIQ